MDLHSRQSEDVDQDQRHVKQEHKKWEENGHHKLRNWKEWRMGMKFAKTNFEVAIECSVSIPSDHAMIHYHGINHATLLPTWFQFSDHHSDVLGELVVSKPIL